MTQQVRPVASGKPRKLDLPKMTYAQFLECDFENPHVEWVNGEVVMMAPASGDHQDVRAFLMFLLQAFTAVHDAGKMRDDPFQMKAGPDLPGRAPDIQFVSKRNLGRLKKNHLEGPADLVVEVISPGSRATDRRDKFHEYETGGVKEYWLIDPERQGAEFFRLGRDKKFHLMEMDGVAVFRSAVLKGFWIRVEWLWQRPLPNVVKIQRELGLV